MFSQIGHDVEKIENDPVCCGVRISEWSHADVTVVVRELDELLALLDPVSVSVTTTPVGLKLLIGDPHLVLRVSALTHLSEISL